MNYEEISGKIAKKNGGSIKEKKKFYVLDWLPPPGYI